MFRNIQLQIDHFKDERKPIEMKHLQDAKNMLERLDNIDEYDEIGSHLAMNWRDHIAEHFPNSQVISLFRSATSFRSGSGPVKRLKSNFSSEPTQPSTEQTDSPNILPTTKMKPTTGLKIL